MRSLGGFVLLAGIGVGLFVYLPAPVDTRTSLDRAQKHTVAPPRTLPAARVQTAKYAAPRSFSPAFALTSVAHRETQARTTSATALAPSATAPASWQSTVVPADNRPIAPSDPSSRYELVVELQQQLKRVGCYWGRVNGAWNANSKDAMKEFMDRVNAALPMEQPDYVLLTLVKAHAGKACGECPAGQVLAAGGRCLPQAIVAQTRRPDEAPRVAAAPNETLPWQRETLPWKQGNGTSAVATAKPLFTPVPTSVVSSEPLPGRMAIGGPSVLPPTDGVDGQAIAVGADPAAATAALVPPATALAPVAPAAPKVRTTSKRPSYRRDGPGTPRYNLMLSLGGVY
jgi:hypothetical protein